MFKQKLEWIFRDSTTNQMQKKMIPRTKGNKVKKATIVMAGPLMLVIGTLHSSSFPIAFSKNWRILLSNLKSKMGLSVFLLFLLVHGGYSTNLRKTYESVCWSRM